MKIKILFQLIILLATSPHLQAQEDLLSLIGEPEASESHAVATFKGTRLINFHTLEVPGKRTLDFRISHRFGSFNSGWYDFFGLDGGASIRLGLEYSYDGRLEVGIGRTSTEKTFDGFLKYRLLRQGEKSRPWVSVTLFSGMYYTNLRDPNKDVNGFDKYEHASSRLSYAHQVIVGRKFNEDFSLQIAPVLVHFNQVDRFSDRNDAFLLTAATRYKFTKRMAVTAEYGWRVRNYSRTKYYDSMGIGIDVETGGHVFQIHLTNSLGLTENQFLTHTTTKWANAGIRLGFNISRVFTI
jgi:hypothetical protein